MTGARYIVSFLEEKGVNTIFGYPGAAVLELYDELRKSKIEYVQSCHEQGAVHAAVGYAKASGKTGVCIATSGPGATNLVTGIADARLDSAPLVVLTGQVDSAVIGRDAFQEADIMGITIPITKDNMLIKEPESLALSLSEGWNIAATGRRGPVLLDITHNVLANDYPHKNIAGILPRHHSSQYPLLPSLKEIEKLINESKKPVILCGGGVVFGGSSAALSAFAKKTDIPTVFTMMGKSALTDCESYGMCGYYGTDCANRILSDSDLCIAAGCRFSDRTISDFEEFSKGRAIIHCDIDDSEISKNVAANIGVGCGAAEFFTELGKLNLPGFNEWQEQCRGYREDCINIKCADALTCNEILYKLNSAVLKRHDTVYITDVGTHQTDAAKILNPVFEGGFIVSGGLGAMGFGLPAAIGASFSADKRAKNIVLICGDGGFQMTLEELSLLHTVHRPVKVFLMDNGGLGMIRNLQDECFGGRRFGTEGKYSPDFEKIASAYSLPSVKIDISERERLPEMIDSILDREESIIVICKVK